MGAIAINEPLVKSPKPNTIDSRIRWPYAGVSIYRKVRMNIKVAIKNDRLSFEIKLLKITNCGRIAVSNNT